MPLLWLVWVWAVWVWVAALDAANPINTERVPTKEQPALPSATVGSVVTILTPPATRWTLQSSQPAGYLPCIRCNPYNHNHL